MLSNHRENSRFRLIYSYFCTFPNILCLEISEDLFRIPFVSIVKQFSVKILTYWKTECTRCRTATFKFKHPRILLQHFTNYCCVVNIHGLLLTFSCRMSIQVVDKNPSETDLIIPNKINNESTKELDYLTYNVPVWIFTYHDFLYVFGIFRRVGK